MPAPVHQLPAQSHPQMPAHVAGHASWAIPGLPAHPPASNSTASAIPAHFPSQTSRATPGHASPNHQPPTRSHPRMPAHFSGHTCRAIPATPTPHHQPPTRSVRKCRPLSQPHEPGHTSHANTPPSGIDPAPSATPAHIPSHANRTTPAHLSAAQAMPRHPAHQLIRPAGQPRLRIPTPPSRARQVRSAAHPLIPRKLVAPTTRPHHQTRTTPTNSRPVNNSQTLPSPLPLVRSPSRVHPPLHCSPSTHSPRSATHPLSIARPSSRNTGGRGAHGDRKIPEPPIGIATITPAIDKPRVHRTPTRPLNHSPRPPTANHSRDDPVQSTRIDHPPSALPSRNHPHSPNPHPPHRGPDPRLARPGGPGGRTRSTPLRTTFAQVTPNMTPRWKPPRTHAYS